MALFKKKITEHEAAALFVELAIKRSKTYWDENIVPWIKENKKFQIQSKDYPEFDFVLGVLAAESQAIDHLLPKEQGGRVMSFIFDLLDIENFGEYARQELSDYRKYSKEDPISGVAGRLLQRLLGKNINNYVEKIGDNKIISPIMMLQCQTWLIVPLGGIWKKILEQYKLVS